MMVPSYAVLERISEQFNTLHCKLDWLGGKIQRLETLFTATTEPI